METDNIFDYTREFFNIAKIYIEKSKYSRKNNNFTFKLIIFTNICNEVNISSKIHMKTFLIILKNLVLDYYYLNIDITSPIINFDQICYLI